MTLLNDDLIPDLEQAKRFLKALDPAADLRSLIGDELDGFTFQTFDDKAVRKDSSLARIYHGTLKDLSNALVTLNRAKAGVFVTINRTDMAGRKAANIIQVRAVWIDDDEGADIPTPLDPHLISETSPGKYHKIFLVSGLSFEQHQQVQNVLVKQYGSDKNAKDLARVLRVPGFYHNKGEPFMVRLIHESGKKPYSAEELLAAFKPKAENNFSAPGRDVTSSPRCSHVHDDVVTEGGRNAFLASLAGSMRRRGMSKEAIEAALLAENSAKCHPLLDDSEVKQIAKSISQYEPSADPLADYQITKQAISELKQNPGAIFELNIIDAMQRIKATDPASFQRLRVAVKNNKHSGVSLRDWDRLITAGGEGSDSTIADKLVDLIRKKCQLFHDDQTGFASIWIEDEHGGHVETWPINSAGFLNWLSFVFYKESQCDGESGTKVAPSEASLKQAIQTANGIAKHDGLQENVYLRCAPYQDGYVIDLCDAHWNVVLVLPTGWKILEESPVKFWRTANMRALPLPNTTGDIEALWRFCNIPAADRVLVLECWRPDTPFPGLEMIGAQGTAKSSTQDRFRQIIDPNKVNLRAAPKSVEDIFVAAGCNWLISFNNLSFLNAEYQDALCTLATGGGFATRKFYTNTDESVIEAKRPWVLNGITPLVTAQDLNDRVIHMDLSPVDYIEETEITRQWDAELPSILGGLLDLFSATLRALPNVTLEHLPRMADFAKLGTAMLQAQGDRREFLELYEANRKESVSRGLEASPAACAVLTMAVDNESVSPVVFEGTMKQLLSVLNIYRPHNGEAWPKSPRKLGDILRRQAPALRTLGVEVLIDSKPQRDGYHVKIVKLDLS
jgi:hypothetical protein